MRRGLELANRDDALAALAKLAGDASDSVRASLLEAASFRRRFMAIDFGACFSSADVDLQRAAAAHLRFAPASVQVEWIDRALSRIASAAQPAAVETALYVGHPSALEACRDLATADIAPSAEMLLLLAMLGTPRDHDRVTDTLANVDRRPLAVWALGFAGRKAGAAACIDLMAQGLETKLAAEAFAAITGLDLFGGGMVTAAAPEPKEPITFEADDLDADLSPRPEDLLPEPDVPAIIRWWVQSQKRFDDQTRYIGGRPITFELLQQLLVDGPMRRRHAIATELSIRTEGCYQVQTRDFTAVQRQQMGGFSTLPREAFAGALARKLTHPARRA
jgi:uncharacterized protein (TIGR02270 family)